MQSKGSVFFAPIAWVQGAWARNVLLTVGANGAWSAIEPDATPAHHPDATVLDAPVLPGLVNAHTHLDLTVLRGRFHGLSFFDWVRNLTAARLDLSPAQLLDSARAGIGHTQRCGVAHGTPAE